MKRIHNTNIPQPIRDWARETVEDGMSKVFANTTAKRDAFPIGIDLTGAPDPDIEWVQVAPGRHRLTYKSKQVR